MTITTTTIKNSYSGNGSNTVFAYTYKILAEGDIEVIVRSANGTETVKTLTTDYTVSGVGSAGGGNVTFVTAPLSTETVVLRRETTQTQSVDLVENDPFTAETVEGAFDRAIVIAQELQEEVDRSIKLSRTNTMTSTEFTVGSAERANKILAFDDNGEISVTQELGTYQGNWGSATDYNARDLVKDTSNNNIYLCNTSHTSSGSQPLSSNTDSAKWDLIVDAASATSSATSAASSATAAASSATAAATSASNAATSESNASTSETNASTSATSASTSATAAATSESNAATSETNAATSETNAATSATSAASSATSAASSATSANSSEASALTYRNEASTFATAASQSATSAATSASNASTSENAAQTYASNALTYSNSASTSATNAAASETAAAASYDSFDDRYLGPKSSAPALDNDGDALLIGALYFDTTSNAMKVYGSSGWQNAGSSINGTSDRFQYSFSSSTTTVTGTDSNGNTLIYDPPYVDVYLNGIKMVNGTDVTVTSGNSVVFASPIGISGTDSVDIIAYGTFNVATIAASAITSGTLGYARGGTGLGSLGSADEVLQVNAGGTALEYGKVDTANIADDAVGATQLDVSGNGTAGQVLKSDGDGTFSWADSASPFAYNAVSGGTPSLDVGTYNFFNQGTLTADTTVSFTNVPTEAQWTYTFEPAIGNSYDLQNITNTGRTFAPTITSSYGLHVGDDGTKLYIGELSSTAADNYVDQYSLSTPYDISTASYVQQYSTNKTYLIDVTFNPNGTKFYTVNFAGADAGKIHEFTLGTAWDISSASFTTSFSVTGQMAASYPRAFTFNDDGTIAYINDTTNNIIFQYTLTTAYDISTMSYATKSFSVGSTHQTFELNDDGTKLFINHVSGTYIDTIREYSLSTAWDISTASYASIDYDYSAISASLSSLHFSNSGASLYMMDTAGTTVYEFSTGEVFSLTLPSSVQNTPAETVGSTGRYTYEFWTADGGTNVYISNEEKFS